MAIIVALMAMLLMSALGTALVLTTSSEVLIAANFRNAQEGVYAADAALEHAMADLASIPEWSSILEGTTPSGLVDGPPSGVRTLADGSLLDLERAREHDGWRLFAYGPLSTLLPAGTIDSSYYVVVTVADGPNPGTDVLVLRAEAFGPRGMHQVIESTVARPGADPAGIRVLSWRLIR